MTHENINPMDKIQTMAYIESLKHQAISGGSITDEKDNFEEIQKKLQNDEISPAAARLAADNIVKSRQDYH